MATTKPEDLEDLDVPERRGVADEADVDSWDATFVRAEHLDVVGDRLVGCGLCGAVQRDVTREALAGTLREPAGKWALLVKLRGHAWAQLAGLWRDYDLPEQIGKASGLETLVVGYQDTANATFVQYYAGGRRAIHFESCGFDPEEEVNDPEAVFEGTRFVSDRHDAAWLKQFESEDEIRHALVAELGAYVPMLFAAGDGQRGIAMDAWHPDVLESANIERIDLAVFGPKEALTAGDASDRLQKAIADHDAAAVRAAIADGADLRFLPGRSSAPLEYAIDSIGRETWTKSLDVVRALLEGGANPDGEPGGNPPVFKALNPFGFDATQSIGLIELLLAHGATVNPTARAGIENGRTLLHQAAMTDQMAIVKLLIARGADATQRDANGHTPREAIAASVKAWQKLVGGKQIEEKADRSEVMMAFLKEAEAGRANTDDVQELAEENRKEETRRRRKLKVAFAELGDLFKNLGQVMEKGSKKAAADLAVMTQPAEIHVRKAKGVRWKDAKGRDAVASQLEKLGFKRIGVFTVKEMPEARLLAMFHPDERAYGVVSEMGKTRWIDLVRYHQDGSVLTVTNTAVPAIAQANLKDKPKLRLPKAKAKALFEALTKKRPPKAGTEKIKPTEFARRVERYYAEEMAARHTKRRAKQRRKVKAK